MAEKRNLMFLELLNHAYYGPRLKQLSPKDQSFLRAFLSVNGKLTPKDWHIEIRNVRNHFVADVLLCLTEASK